MAAVTLALLSTAQQVPGSAASTSSTTTTDESVSYQADVGHSGAVLGDSLAPPLTRAWKVDLGGPAGTPLLADNRVFVIAGNRDWSGTRLFALDPASGSIIWGPIDLGGGSGGLYGVQYVAGTPNVPAYDSGKIFASDGAGFTDAFDATTGALLWHTRPDHMDAYFNASPLAINGTVYAHAYMSPGDRNYALNEADGSVRWFTNDPYGTMAASSTALFLNAGCDWVAAIDAQTGATLWRNQGFGSAAATAPVLYQGRLYTQTYWVPQGKPANEILDATTGAYLGTFDASFQTFPAFDAGRGFWLTGSALKAVTLTTMTTAWTFSGDGHIDTSPVIANGVVYVGSSTGTIFGVSEASGSQVWSETTGTPITSWPESVGLAVGQGSLAVPAGTALSFYRSSAATAPAPIPPVTYPAPAHGGSWSTGDEATAFRIDPAHDANQASDPLAPPLQQAWSIDLGHPISYPVIADGRVFVSVSDGVTTPHTTLYALNRRTGKQVWSKGMNWAGPALAAFDGGVLLALTAQDELSALDPATGAVRWSSKVSGSIGGTNYYGALGDPPVATGGRIYDGAGNIGGVLYAFRESDGMVLWQKGTFNSIAASPTADAAANVYLTFGLNSSYSYTPDGQSRWNLLPTGADDASITAAFHQSKIYELGGGNATRDAATGAPGMPFSSATPGALDGDIGVFLVGHTLQAIDLRNNHVLWSTIGDGGFITEPVIAGGNVYEGSTSGKLYVVDDTHGATLWTGDAGAPFTIAGSSYGGLAVGEGTLIAPAGTRLVAYAGGFDAAGHVALLPALANSAYGGYLTTAYVKNDGAAPAEVRIDYVDSAGNPAGFEYKAALPSQATWIVRQDDGRFPAGQAGSGIVTSSQPVATFVNEAAPNGGDGSSYTGINMAAGAGPSVYAPAIARNAYGGYTTGIGLINAGKEATDVQVTYRDTGGNVVKQQTLSAVSPGAYRGVYSGNSGSATDANLPDGFAGTATITSVSTPAQPLAAVINEDGPGGQFNSYDAIAAGAATLSAPTAMKNAYGGYNTGMGIQNLSGSGGTVAVQYFSSDGTLAATTTHAIAAYGYLGIYQGTDLTASGAYSATITTTTPGVMLAAIVNEVAPPGVGLARQSTSYNTFLGGVSVANLPLVESAGSDGWSTGLSIINTGTSTTTVTVTYFDMATGAPVGTSASKTLAPKAFWGVYQPDNGLPNGTRAGAQITSSGGTVAVICNESSATSFMSYDGQ